VAGPRRGDLLSRRKMSRPTGVAVRRDPGSIPQAPSQRKRGTVFSAFGIVPRHVPKGDGAKLSNGGRRDPTTEKCRLFV